MHGSSGWAFALAVSPVVLFVGVAACFIVLPFDRPLWPPRQITPAEAALGAAPAALHQSLMTGAGVDEPYPVAGDGIVSHRSLVATPLEAAIIAGDLPTFMFLVGRWEDANAARAAELRCMAVAHQRGDIAEYLGARFPGIDATECLEAEAG